MNSGVAFRRVFDELNQVNGQNVVEIGINGWFNTRFYHEYIREKGITIFTARDVHLKGMSHVVEEALRIAADKSPPVALDMRRAPIGALLIFGLN